MASATTSRSPAPAGQDSTTDRWQDKGGFNSVVGCFPDGRSALMLVAARLRHMAGTKWGTNKYLDTGLLAQLDLVT